MEKTLLVHQREIDLVLQEISQLKELYNKIYSLLNEFGIEDPAAVKSPIEAVNSKLKDSIKVQGNFEVAPHKAAELIGKSQQYNDLITISKETVNHPHAEKIRWNKKSFSINANVRKDLTREFSVIITDPDQIKLAERVDAFINEAHSLANDLGKKIIPMNLLKVFPGLLIYKERKFCVNPRNLNNYTNKA